ncbi:MAG TPA: zf-HC2 domain-containing protein [Gemmatimonadaceae bacterium]|nr:zf-HC2 domain-containing protein [Gemmatimonadaceae bacterium]
MSASSMQPMLDCDAVMRQLWDYLDGELTSDRVAAIRAHLALCERCYPQYEFERTFLETVARARREHPDPGRVQEHVMAALRADGFGGV